MTFQNRAADARLIRIERALLNAENRLDAAAYRSGENGMSDVTALHEEVAKLAGEAVYLRPISPAGLASKARIVIRHYELGEIGLPLLFSLVEDLQSRCRHRR